MLIILYKTKDSNNTLNKTLEDERSFDIVFKNNANILRPTIILNSKLSLLDFNYCYIPDFKRFYFITDITIQGTDLFHFDLRCDVLESFKNEILECSGVVNKKTNGESYLDNHDYTTEVRKECDVFKSNIRMEDDLKYIVILLKRE